MRFHIVTQIYTFLSLPFLLPHASGRVLLVFKLATGTGHRDRDGDRVR